MSDKKLKWGILGAARVNERLLPAIIEAPNAQLVAIASRRAGAAQATLKKYAPCYAEGVQCYDDLDSLITDKKARSGLSLTTLRSVEIGCMHITPSSTVFCSV